RDWERGQSKADELQQIELTKQKAIVALDVQKLLHEEEDRRHRQLREDEHRRQKELIAAYGQLDANKLLEVAMVQNPHVKDDYVALKQAQGQQQQIASLKEFHKTVQDIYGENSERAHLLLLEVAKQAGMVTGKWLESEKTIVIKGAETGTPPRSPGSPE